MNKKVSELKEEAKVCTVKGEGIDGRIDDGDDGNPVGANLHSRVPSSATHCVVMRFLLFSIIQIWYEITGSGVNGMTC